jgi:hypothetical protein
MMPLPGGRFQRPYLSPDSIKPRQSNLPLGAVELERGISPISLSRTLPPCELGHGTVATAWFE